MIKVDLELGFFVCCLCLSKFKKLMILFDKVPCEGTPNSYLCDGTSKEINIPIY